MRKVVCPDAFAYPASYSTAVYARGHGDVLQFFWILSVVGPAYWQWATIQTADTARFILLLVVKSKQANACWIPLPTGASPQAEVQWGVEITSVTSLPSSAWRCSQISAQLNSKQKHNSRRELWYSLRTCFPVTSQLSRNSTDICDFPQWIIYPLGFWKSTWLFENTEKTGYYGYWGQYIRGRAQVIPYSQQATSTLL